MSEEQPNLEPAPGPPAFEPPTPRSGVDLSDLQAELDAERRNSELDELVAAEFDAPDNEDDADAANDGDGGKDGEGYDADAEDNPSTKAQGRKKSRGDRYRDQITRDRDQIARLENENAQLRSRSGGNGHGGNGHGAEAPPPGR